MGRKRMDIIGKWLLCLLLFTSFASCSGSSDDPVTPTEHKQPVITFYVYAPERPLITRATTDEVNASAAERAIHQLQIWVFETGTDRLVGYLAPTAFPTTTEGQIYQMNVSEAFANAKTKPNVDVYVVANLANKSFTENTTRTYLEEALINGDEYGVATPQNTVPESGLPMTGVLRNQLVVGENPVLRIGDYSDMAKVQLRRMVSKVRVVISKGITAPTLAIHKVQIDGSMIPDTEYLFLQSGSDTRVSNTYVASAAQLLATSLDDVNKSANPLMYIYNPANQTAQQYDEMISLAVSKSTPDLTDVGTFYFRETDKKVQGSITYKAGEDAEKTVSFKMNDSDVNSSFSRNHSWIVYAYYEGFSGMQVVTVDVTDWNVREDDHVVYNW